MLDYVRIIHPELPRLRLIRLYAVNGVNSMKLKLDLSTDYIPCVYIEKVLVYSTQDPLYVPPLSRGKRDE